MSSPLKYLFSRYYKAGKAYKIPFGGLRGQRLYYRNDVNYREMLGLWENKSLKILSRLFKAFNLDKQPIIVADVGSNLGYYALFFAKNLYPGSKIFAFEPSETVVELLKSNIEVNAAGNVEIQNMACSDKPGEIDFFIGKNHHQSSIYSEWADSDASLAKKTVKATSLDSFFSERNIYPDLIKMDIEGGGVFALKGCDKCFSTKRAFVLVESHTAAEDTAIGRVIKQYNYEALRIDNMKWVINKDNNYKDPDGVWGSMLLIPSELKQQFTI